MDTYVYKYIDIEETGRERDRQTEREEAMEIQRRL